MAAAGLRSRAFRRTNTRLHLFRCSTNRPPDPPKSFPLRPLWPAPTLTNANNSSSNNNNHGGIGPQASNKLLPVDGVNLVVGTIKTDRHLLQIPKFRERRPSLLLQVEPLQGPPPTLATTDHH